MWRLDQLRGLAEGELFVRGEPAETDADTLLRLPTLLGAALLGSDRQPLGQLADAAVELRSGRILHYLVARSDPRLPGGSRWRLSPERIVDQRPGEVFTALQGLEDLPLAHASLRETLLRRSRRWRDQWSEESSRWREQFQEVSGRVEQRLEGWLEEPPWEEPQPSRPRRPLGEDIWEEASEFELGEEPWGEREEEPASRWDSPERDRSHQERDAWDPEADGDPVGFERAGFGGADPDGADELPPPRSGFRRGDGQGRRPDPEARERPLPGSNRRPRPPVDQDDDPWI